jgi:deoxyribonuclease-4
MKMEKLLIGQHVSFKSEDQLLGSAKEALSYNSNTFMFYTGAPQNTNRKPISSELTKKALELLKENNIDINDVVVHAPYIINLANPTNSDFGIRFLKEEIKRCEELKITKIVLHPGSHVGLGIDEAINNIANSLNYVIDENTKVDICLETMAGKGTEVGFTFEQLKKIIDLVKYNDKVKVCLDTCHINDAGYDLNNFDNILEQFDQIIGLKKLACVHINDSKNEIGTHKDRHENFGFGTIGYDNLMNVIYHEKLKGIPKILETPYVSIDGGKDRTYPPYKFEIEMIKNKKFNTNLLEDIRNFYK